MTKIDALATRSLGSTGIEITTLAFGTAPLASVFWGNDRPTAVEAVRVARRAGLSLFDTAPFYGLGEAEERLGAGLADSATSDVHVATKVGRTLTRTADARDVIFDFSANSVRRQLESSLVRLGRDKVDIVHVHDPEDHLDQALDECLPALADARSEGLLRAISVGTNVCATVERFLVDADLDVVMLAGRLTLLDQQALHRVVPACAERGVPLLAAGVFNSGVLASPVSGRWFDYARADDATLARARSIAATCERFAVPLRAAAMAYPLRHDVVHGIVVGMATADQVDDNIATLGTDIPDELWEALGL